MGIMCRIWATEKTGFKSLRCLRWRSPVVGLFQYYSSMNTAKDQPTVARSPSPSIKCIDLKMKYQFIRSSSCERGVHLRQKFLLFFVNVLILHDDAVECQGIKYEELFALQGDRLAV